MKFTIQFLDLLLYFLILIIVVLFSALLYMIRKQNDEARVLKAKKLLLEEDEIKNETIQKLSDCFKSKHTRRYRKLQIYLSRIGVNYMMKRVVDPVEFLLAKYMITIMLGFVGFTIYKLVGMVVGVLIGFNFLNVIFSMSNRKDNDNILADIRSIYDTLKIKTESGVFLTQSIRQCYKVVENKRLKDALLTLSSELSTTNNIKNAVDTFQMKFKNRYIDQLCVTIRQSYESGSTINNITDISNNLNNMQKAIEISEKSKLETDILISQVLLLCEILIVILYTVLTQMSSTLSSM